MTATGPSTPGRIAPVQTCLDELGTPLHDVTFVVVDLETSGGRPGATGITEIGAVKVRGGEIVGEFATLVDPECAIPPQIQRLTGITTLMVHDAPRIASVLPAFLAFLDPGAVLVAHNAPFDVGFLKAAASALDVTWPKPEVLDTLRVARALVPRDEVRNHRLGTLAAHFAATTTPNHRALADARATVDILHALIARAGSLGVTTREDLLGLSSRVPEARRRRSNLAHGLPEAPGVYVFVDDAGTPLYVGTSGNIRRRVRSYFTASETRRGMGLMVDLATAVTPIPCATPLEAHVREIRLIAQHRPRFNKRSARPERTAWVKITSERYPRLSVVRDVRDDGGHYLGPFSSSRGARAAREALHEVSRIRQCTQKIGRIPSSPCVLAELGRCDAPCLGELPVQEYEVMVKTLHAELTHTTRPLVSRFEERLATLVEQERFEQARTSRDGMLDLLKGLDRHQRRAPLVVNPQLIAARAAGQGAWEFVLIRYGRLAGAATSAPGSDPRPVIESLKLTAEHVSPALAQSTLVEETDVLLRWLERPEVRLVESEAPWFSPVAGASGPSSNSSPQCDERARASRRPTAGVSAELVQAPRDRRVLSHVTG